MDCPRCRNKSCPDFRKKPMILLKESDTEWTFGCTTCNSVNVQTRPAGWLRASQENKYRTYGRPEYARVKATFDLGRRR